MIGTLEPNLTSSFCGASAGCGSLGGPILPAGAPVPLLFKDLAEESRVDEPKPILGAERALALHWLPKEERIGAHSSETPPAAALTTPKRSERLKDEERAVFRRESSCRPRARSAPLGW